MRVQNRVFMRVGLEKSLVPAGMEDMETSSLLNTIVDILHGMDTCLPFGSKWVRKSSKASQSVYLDEAVTQPDRISILKSGGMGKASIHPDTSVFPNRSIFLPIFSLLLLSGHFCETIAIAPDSRPVFGTQAVGLGGAFISNSDGATAAFWNSAGLANLRCGSIVYDLSQGAVSVAYPIRHYGTVGFSLADLNDADRFIIKDSKNPFGTFEFGNNQAVLSYARNVGSWKMGGNINHTRAPYEDSHWQPSFDLGVISELSTHWTVGVSLRDISGVIIRDVNGRSLEEFPQQLSIGATWLPIGQIQMSNAFNLTTNEVGVGLEISGRGAALRFGSVLNLNALNASPDWSLGFTLSRWANHIHYALLARSNRNAKHCLSVEWKFGVGPRPRSLALRDVQSTDVKPLEADKNTKISLPNRLANRHDIEVELILAVIRVESDFNPMAVSSSGAAGLMQLMPPTAQELGLEVPNYRSILKPQTSPEIDERFDARKNLNAGVMYLKAMLERYGGSYLLAVAAYNVGPGHVHRNAPVPKMADRHVGKVLQRYYEYKGDALLRENDLGKLKALLGAGN